MAEAVFGLVGVLIGSVLTWIQHWRTENKALERNARYLAVRVVWVLDKYIIDCSYVVKDHGYDDYGQKGRDGTLEPQVKQPVAPVYPEDVDWKSIDSHLMYQLLSFPSEINKANNTISGTHFYTSPPDYEEFFEERQYQYACLGLKAIELEQKLRSLYKLPQDDERSDLKTFLLKSKTDIENNRTKREEAL